MPKIKNFQAAPEPYFSSKGFWTYYYDTKLSTSRKYNSMAQYGYLNHTFYLKTIYKSPVETDMDFDRKDKKRKLQSSLGVKRSIAVLDTKRENRSNGYTYVFQFHCLLDTPPTYEKLKEIEAIGKSYTEVEV